MLIGNVTYYRNGVLQADVDRDVGYAYAVRASKADGSVDVHWTPANGAHETTVLRAGKVVR